MAIETIEEFRRRPVARSIPPGGRQPYRVFTPFVFDDGITRNRPEGGGGWRSTLTDEGIPSCTDVLNRCKGAERGPAESDRERAVPVWWRQFPEFHPGLIRYRSYVSVEITCLLHVPGGSPWTHRGCPEGQSVDWHDPILSEGKYLLTRSTACRSRSTPCAHERRPGP